MVSRTLIRYFGMRFLGAVDVGVRRHLRADRAGRLHRVHAARLRRAEPVHLDGREGLVLPRAATDRAAAALLGAGRRDGVLPRALAAQRTGRRPLRRHVGLAVRRPGRDRGVRDRAGGDRALQSALGVDARNVEAARGGDLRRQAVRAAGERSPASGCGSAASTANRSFTRRQARNRACASTRSACSPSTTPASRWNASRPSAPCWSRGTGGSTRPASMSAASPPRDYDTYLVKTNLTAAQVRESFSTPETVPFWELPAYIEIAERSGLVAAGYKLQYHLLIARPFLLSAMVLLACSVSLRFFRFGGVAKNGFEWRGGRVSALCSVQGD